MSSKWMALLGLGVLASEQFPQERMDEVLAAKLVRDLRVADRREGAIVELLKMGPLPARFLVEALAEESDLLSGKEEIAWKESVLMALIFMSKSGEPALDALEEGFGNVPEELIPLGLRAWGEISFWRNDSRRAAPLLEMEYEERDGRTSIWWYSNKERAGAISVAASPELFLPDLKRALVRRESLSPDGSRAQAVQWLESTNPTTFEAGLDLVRHYGHSVIESIPKLQAALSDARFEDLPYGYLVRFKAASVIVKIAPDDPRSSLAYGYLAVHHYDPRMRARSALATVRTADDFDECIPFLIAGLSDDNTKVLQQVITALGVIGPGAEEACSKLEELAGHQDPQVGVRARAALRKIRGRRGPSTSWRLSIVPRDGRASSARPECADSRSWLALSVAMRTMGVRARRVLERSGRRVHRRARTACWPVAVSAESGTEDYVVEGNSNRYAVVDQAMYSYDGRGNTFHDGELY